MKRPTIADIARHAGVTKAAVSFALNGQPGVSAVTRERILAIAAEIGFEPSSAARALSDGRAGAFGLVIDRPARTLGSEVFFMQLISGIQADLARNRITLLFTMAEDQAEEIRMYRTWWAQRKVDGVFLVDLHALAEVARAAGLEAVSVAAGYTAEHGAEATRDLLKQVTPPTAILYDNDVMAVAGLGAAQRMGVPVPAELSIVVWDDSALCELVHPAFTALRRDIAAAGAAAAQMLREAVAGQSPGHLAEAPPVLILRDSTAPPPASAGLRAGHTDGL